VKDFYTAFYRVTEHSAAHHVFCERSFGLDLCQHGFADLDQLHLLLGVTRLAAGQRVLDVGCGNGMIAEYLSDRSGAHITGLDYIPQAIHQARQRTGAKSDRMAFAVGDINQLDLPAGAFDAVLSIDTLYFSNDITATLADFQAALRPDGQMAILYSHGREPGAPIESFSKETTLPDRTPLAVALQAAGLPYRTWDLTRQDYEQARRRKQVLVALKPQFEAEGALFIYDNRMGEAEGISQAIEDGLHARYLYHIQPRHRGESGCSDAAAGGSRPVAGATG
jgi:ubiquinone/menaquinone biosynthesis C-methylase UbiE